MFWIVKILRTGVLNNVKARDLVDNSTLQAIFNSICTLETQVHCTCEIKLVCFNEKIWKDADTAHT